MKKILVILAFMLMSCQNLTIEEKSYRWEVGEKVDSLLYYDVTYESGRQKSIKIAAARNDTLFMVKNRSYLLGHRITGEFNEVVKVRKMDMLDNPIVKYMIYRYTVTGGRSLF